MHSDDEVATKRLKTYVNALDNNNNIVFVFHVEVSEVTLSRSKRVVCLQHYTESQHQASCPTVPYMAAPVHSQRSSREVSYRIYTFLYIPWESVDERICENWSKSALVMIRNEPSFFMTAYTVDGT